MARVDSLRPHPKNPNKGDAGAIYESIEENGFYGVVVAQKSTRLVLVGNHRREAAEMRGMEEIPVCWVDVDDDRALRIMLADNRLNRLGSDNEVVLAELLAEMKNSTDSLAGTGFDEDYLDDLIGDLSKQGITIDTGTETVSFEANKVPKEKLSTFGVFIPCEGEGQQREMVRRLRDEGYDA